MSNIARISTISFAVLILCQQMLPAQTETPTHKQGETKVYNLNDVPMQFYALNKWGIRYYELYHYRKKKFKDRGMAVTERDVIHIARTKMETRINGDEIILRQYWRDQSGTVSRVMVECHCAMDNHLSLQKMVARYQDKEVVCDVTGGKYDYDLVGYPRKGKWPKDTIIDVALMRIVTMLPRWEGAVFTFTHWSPTPELNVRPVRNEPIKCYGKETIKIGGKSMKCTKYQSANIHMWVRDDDVLVRVEIPGWKILELSEPVEGDESIPTTAGAED